MSTLTYEQANEIIRFFTQRYSSKDYAGLLDLFADDVIFEFPYAPEPYSKRLDGKAELQQHLEMLEGVLEITSFTTPIVHVSANSPTFFAQFESRGKNLVKGETYEQHYISVVEVQNGKIVRYQDYWNPLEV